MSAPQKNTPQVTPAQQAMIEKIAKAEAFAKQVYANTKRPRTVMLVDDDNDTPAPPAKRQQPAADSPKKVKNNWKGMYEQTAKELDYVRGELKKSIEQADEEYKKGYHEGYEDVKNDVLYHHVENLPDVLLRLLVENHGLVPIMQYLQRELPPVPPRAARPANPVYRETTVTKEVFVESPVEGSIDLDSVDE